MQVIEKKNLKNYCKTIFEEHGFCLQDKFKSEFSKDYGEFIVYTTLHRNIEIIFSIDYKDNNKHFNHRVKCFHLNGNYGAVELVFNNLDRIIERLKTVDIGSEYYFFLIFLQEENHAIFTRYFLKRNAKIYTQDYFSTKVGFVDLEPKAEGNIKYEEDDVSLVEAIYSISDTDSSGT